MPADVALRQCAIDRVGHRVHAHVRIRMAHQCLVVRHAHAAQNHVIARPEPVHVVAIAKADIHRCLQIGGGAGEIRGAGDFQVVFGTGHDGNA